MLKCKSCGHKMGNYWCPKCQRDTIHREKYPGINMYQCYQCRTTYEKPEFRCFKCFGTEYKEGCYIATCIYGSYDCPEVLVLRRFRDNELSQSYLGRIFIHVYYTLSPHIVRKASKQKWFHSLLKPFLDGIVRRLQKGGFSRNP